MDYNELLKNFKLKTGTSEGFDLDANDVVKLFRDAGIVGIGATIAYLMAHMSDVDFGKSTFVLVPAISLLLNMIYKWVRDNSPQNNNPYNNYNNYNNNNNLNNSGRGGPDFKPDFTPDVPNNYRGIG